MTQNPPWPLPDQPPTILMAPQDSGRPCPVCKEQIPMTPGWHGSQREYCGDGCKRHAAAQRRYARAVAGELFTKECRVCKKFFGTHRDKAKYCSVACVNLRGTVNKPAPAPPPAKTDRKCAVCGDQFTPYGTHAKFIYCGKDCSDIARSRKTVKGPQESKRQDVERSGKWVFRRVPGVGVVKELAS